MGLQGKIPTVYNCKRCGNKYKNESIVPVRIEHWLFKNTQNVYYMCRKCINAELEFKYLELFYPNGTPITKESGLLSIYDLRGDI